jgi:serine O-acetyltransferase
MKPKEGFEKVVGHLCDLSKHSALYHIPWHDMDLPSIDEIRNLTDVLRETLFPGYFGDSKVRAETLHHIIGSRIHTAYNLLSKQINRGFCFYCTEPQDKCKDCKEKSQHMAGEFIRKLPYIKKMLASDALAAYNGDPANKHISEAIFCYPSMTAITYHRIAHELLLLGVPLIPRIISEIAHSITGIDIHPGATIGEGFFIDHGTGVVIGETSVIGNNVRIYQGVTLGAKSFPLDEEGNPVKGIKRHPIVEDDVIIYANATILGRITIGRGAIIGGNVWVSEDVPPGTRVVLKLTT